MLIPKKRPYYEINIVRDLLEKYPNAVICEHTADISKQVCYFLNCNCERISKDVCRYYKDYPLSSHILTEVYNFLDKCPTGGLLFRHTKDVSDKVVSVLNCNCERIDYHTCKYSVF